MQWNHSSHSTLFSDRSHPLWSSSRIHSQMLQSIFCQLVTYVIVICLFVRLFQKSDKMWSSQLLQRWYTKTIVWHSIVSHANTSPWGNNWIKPLLYIVSHTFMAPCNIKLPLEHRNEHHPTSLEFELDLNRVIVVNVSIISIDKNNTHRNHSLASCAKT